MTVISDIIRSSMRKIGVLDAGDPLDAGEGSDALDAFKNMVDAWALEPLLIPPESADVQWPFLGSTLADGTEISLSSEVLLPAGYERSLAYNLCLELADEWGREIPSAIAIHASESKKNIKRKNYEPLKLRVDKGITRTRQGSYDIHSGPS